MADKMKHDFHVLVVRQVALDNVPRRNGHSSQNFSEEPMFIFFIVKNDQKCPNETIDCKGGEFGILYKASKWPVLYEMDNQWL